MIRIISGNLKGRKLHNYKNEDIRPTQAKVRKSIFDSIRDFENKSILDLFAGMGTLGIESISRGAKEVKFIEKRYRIAQLIEKNIEKLGIKENSVVIKSDVINFLNFDKGKYDIVFADPPYGKFSFEEIFPSVISLIKDGGIFCYESNKQNIDDNIPVKIKYFGNTQVVIWEKK